MSSSIELATVSIPVGAEPDVSPRYRSVVIGFPKALIILVAMARLNLPRRPFAGKKGMDCPFTFFLIVSVVVASSGRLESCG